MVYMQFDTVLFASATHNTFVAIFLENGLFLFSGEIVKFYVAGLVRVVAVDSLVFFDEFSLLA